MELSQFSRHQRNDIVYFENDEGQQEDGILGFISIFCYKRLFNVLGLNVNTQNYLYP